MKKTHIFSSLVMLTASTGMFANPKGLHVVSGEAEVAHPDSATMQITTGKQAILNWDSFSIQESETTRFVMPDSSASVLNRVIGGDLSQLLGTLEANGKVYLVNAKGVLVGKNALIDTSSFIASSFDILDEAFLNGDNLMFARTGDCGAIINLGAIITRDGETRLIGNTIDNQGKITALKTRSEGGRVFLIADEGEIINSGTIIASEGEIQLFAKNILVSKSTLFDVSGNQGGTMIIGGVDKNNVSADTVIIEKGALLSSDGYEENGGIITLFSKEKTDFSGHASARAFDSGNGGTIDISSLNLVNIDDHPDLRSVQGIAGTLLLDPGPVFVMHGANVPPSSDMSTITDGWINAQLVSGSLVISTGNSTAPTPPPPMLTIEGNVNISWATANSLTFEAVNANVVAIGTAIIQSTGSGNLSFLSLGTGSGAGGVIFGPASMVSVNNGNLLISAGAQATRGIVVSNSSTIQSTGMGNITLQTSGGGLLTGPIQIENASKILSTGTGTVNLTTDNGLIDISTNGAITSAGNISISVTNHGNFKVETGGSITGIGSANFDANIIGNMTLQNNGIISANSGTISIELQKGNLQLIGGTSSNQPALINPTSGNVNITLNSLNSTSGAGLQMTGGIDSTSYAQIGSIKGGASGNIIISAINNPTPPVNTQIQINAGSANGFAHIGHGTLTNTSMPFSGDITLSNIMAMTVKGTTKTSGPNGFAQIGHLNSMTGTTTLGGNISINSLYSITVTGGNTASGYARIGPGGQAGTITPLMGTTYNTLSIANYNTTLSSQTGHAQFAAPFGNATIVVDNHFPTNPGHGSGAFSMNTNTLISAKSGNLCKIYTSQRGLNTVPNGIQINGTTYVEQFPAGITTAQEAWGVYYNNTLPPANGNPFSIYYKVL